jgi:CNT family concentrative nucleoside transporter
MVKAYLDKMNRSEIFLVMTAGMATVAGGVLAAYVGFLGGDDPEHGSSSPSTCSPQA